MSGDDALQSIDDSHPAPILYIVATPIGNLGDFTARAIEILRTVNKIYCEDTRRTKILCNHYQIPGQLQSYRVHRMDQDTASVLRDLEQGLSVAFVSDAGTPGISDPGSALVGTIRKKRSDIPIVPVPGASALTAALSVSGFPSSPFLFLGFLSPKTIRRKNSLQPYKEFEGSIVIFESVHRIRSLLADLKEVFPNRETFLGREMTKHHESYTWITDENVTEKGEFAIVLSPPDWKKSEKREEF